MTTANAAVLAAYHSVTPCW